MWNVGEAPVDGATDLGFMFLLAAVRTFGVDAQTAALIVNSLAFLAVAGGMFVFARLRQIPPVPALLVSALFFLSPAAALIHAGFGAVFFGASIAFVAIAMFRLTDEPTARNAIHRTGNHFSVLGGTDSSLTGIKQDRADIIGDPNSGTCLVNGVQVAVGTSTCWFNTSAFANAAAGNFGTSSRNSLEGTGLPDVQHWSFPPVQNP